MAFFREFTAESCRRALPLPKGSVGLLSSADDDTGRGAHIISYYDRTSYLLILGFITDGRFAGEFTQRRLVHQVCSWYRSVGERRRMSRKALARPISESVFNESGNRGEASAPSCLHGDYRPGSGGAFFSLSTPV